MQTEFWLPTSCFRGTTADTGMLTKTNLSKNSRIYTHVVHSALVNVSLWDNQVWLYLRYIHKQIYRHIYALLWDLGWKSMYSIFTIHTHTNTHMLRRQKSCYTGQDQKYHWNLEADKKGIPLHNNTALDWLICQTWLSWPTISVHFCLFICKRKTPRNRGRSRAPI